MIFPGRYISGMFRALGILKDFLRIEHEKTFRERDSEIKRQPFYSHCHPDELKFIYLANMLPMNNFQKFMLIVSFLYWILVDEIVKGTMVLQQFLFFTCDDCSEGIEISWVDSKTYLRWRK